MAITYILGDSLYINLTNRCSNSCDFCIRLGHGGVGDADSLWLNSEPSVEDVLSEIISHDLEKFKEIVFCGFGEPFERADDLIGIARGIKERVEVKIRVNTNGHGNLIAGKNICPDLENIIDILSISLNYKSAREYIEHCKPRYGVQGYFGMLEFAKEAKKHIPEVILSVMDLLSVEDIGQCRKIAEEIGVGFRVRTFE